MLCSLSLPTYISLVNMANIFWHDSEKANRNFPVPGAGLSVLFYSYPEMVTGFFFILMTVLWFTREPGFVPGWDSFFEK